MNILPFYQKRKTSSWWYEYSTQLPVLLLLLSSNENKIKFLRFSKKYMVLNCYIVHSLGIAGRHHSYNSSWMLIIFTLDYISMFVYCLQASGVKVSEEVKQKYDDIKKKKCHRYLVFYIKDEKTIAVEKIGR